MDQRLNLMPAIALATAALLASGQATAHAKLARSNPAAGAVVPAPKVLTLVFTEKLTPAFSGFHLVMVEHNMKIPVTTTVSKDRKTISGKPQGAFMKGAYKIVWSAATGDGHRMTGDVPFKVK